MAPTGLKPVIIERAVPIYRAFMLELERRRVSLGISMDALSDKIGCADRYWAKVLFADRPSGRVARWDTLQEMIDALYPDGVDIVLKPKVGERLTAEGQRLKVRFAQADHDRLSRREIMRELGKKGGKARSNKLTEARKLKIARKASRAAARKRAERAAAQEAAAKQPLLQAAE
ncbi:MAG: hypothetical protein K5821_13455 [Nitrobacter sp.]|uniref:hypothetical protein n=1 Tax=Nitrobacter sp. TaxID=29420 RepID=UPI002606485F|nr:hypothetical protein [Nitrobacter sp.]MCV0387410.1 hypothetical protein [Nitrobacter sp.]